MAISVVFSDLKCLVTVPTPDWPPAGEGVGVVVVDDDVVMLVVWPHAKCQAPAVGSRALITARRSAPEFCHIFVLFMTSLACESRNFSVLCQNLSQRLARPSVSTSFDRGLSGLILPLCGLFLAALRWQTWRCAARTRCQAVMAGFVVATRRCPWG